jgi:hypothetical protein
MARSAAPRQLGDGACRRRPPTGRRHERATAAAGHKSADAGQSRPNATPGGARNRLRCCAHRLPRRVATAHLDGRRTRCRPVTPVLAPPRVAIGTKSSPEKRPAGSRNQAATPRPRTGNDVRYVAESSSTRRRAVEDAPTTSSRPTARHGHPRPTATSRARRVFRSMAWIIACESGTTDFTSTTSTVAEGRHRPRTSIDPRSPRIEYDASTIVSQPARARRSTTASTRRACAASSSRSRPSPCHRRAISTDAPRLPATE